MSSKKKLKTIKAFLVIVCTLLFRVIYSKTLIWDFGGIVFNPDKLGVASHIGLNRFISYMILDFQNPNIQKLIFNFLDQIVPEESYLKYSNKKLIAAGSGESMPLPLIMCYWQSGKISGPQIIDIAKKYIRYYSKLGYFRSTRESELVEKTIEAMFNPRVLAYNVYPVRQGINLLKECALAQNSNGTKKNINIAFSNWDSLSFKIFYERSYKHFKHFDKIMISGDIGFIKPHKRAYMHLIKTFKLDPNDCILIDDQEINAKGAQECGIKSLILNNWDYNSLKKDLKLLNVL